MPRHAKHYGAVSIFLHWTIGIGVLAVGLTELLRGELSARGSAMRETLKAIHEPAGLILFALIVVRVVWRLTHRVPGMPEGMRAWETVAARATHGLLYALLVAVPLLGLATTAARGRPIDFGLFQIAVPMAGGATRDTARLLKNIHEIAGQLILALAGLHAAAALWHHYVRLDDVLTRMLPRLRRVSE